MNYLNLHTVLTAVECGRLLDAAKSTKSRSGKILDAELLFRVAAGRVARAIREWGGWAGMETHRVVLESLSVQATKYGPYYRLDSAEAQGVGFTWCPELRCVMLSQPYVLLEAQEEVGTYAELVH